MLNIIKTAIQTSNHKMGVVSNNIANAGTSAFKRSEALFHDIYLKSAGTGPKLGNGATVEANRVSHNPAEVKRTGVTTDLAIDGHGMFITANPNDLNDITFTRNGSFQLNNQGYLTTNEGRLVLGEDLTAIRVEYEKNGVPLSQFNVTRQGYVLAAYGVAEGEPIARLGLANFDNPTALEQLGNGAFAATDKAGLYGIFPPTRNGTGSVLSGHLEVSNVDLVNELVALIQTQQGFSAASKAIQADNDMVARFTRG